MPKKAVQILIRNYSVRVVTLLEQARQAGEVAESVDLAAAAVQFIGSIQGLVIQATLEGQPERMRERAPAIFILYRRGIEVHP